MRITDTEEEGEKREIKHSAKNYNETLSLKMRVHQ